jgi:hypothetical protein
MIYAFQGALPLRLTWAELKKRYESDQVDYEDPYFNLSMG